MKQYITVTRFLFILKRRKLIALFEAYKQLNPSINQIDACNCFLAELQSFKQFLK